MFEVQDIFLNYWESESVGTVFFTAFSILSLKNSQIVFIKRESTSNSGRIFHVRIAYTFWIVLYHSAMMKIPRTEVTYFWSLMSIPLSINVIERTDMRVAIFFMSQSHARCDLISFLSILNCFPTQVTKSMSMIPARIQNCSVGTFKYWKKVIATRYHDVFMIAIHVPVVQSII